MISLSPLQISITVTNTSLLPPDSAAAVEVCPPTVPLGERLDGFVNASRFADSVLGLAKQSSRTLAQTAIRYLVLNPQFSPHEKAVIWEAFAKRIKAIGLERWDSKNFRGADDSYIFIGEADDALVIPTRAPHAGKIYRGKIDQTVVDDAFVPDYPSLRLLEMREAPHTSRR